MPLRRTVKARGDDFPEAALGPAPGAGGRIRAITHIGSGCSLRPIAGRPGFLDYVLCSTIDLNGALWATVVNAAMTTSLVQSTKQMQDYLARGT